LTHDDEADRSSAQASRRQPAARRSPPGAVTNDPMPAHVAAAFTGFPRRPRRRLLEVRGLIFETAAHIEGVGPLTETLKWGEPAYLTEATGSGSTIRLGWFRSSERHCAVLFNCRTTLVEDFRSQFPDAFAFEKNRAILLDCHKPLPKAALSVCLGMALTYHRRR
jgi:Domain of unknown function (DU1801)